MSRCKSALSTSRNIKTNRSKDSVEVKERRREEEWKEEKSRVKRREDEWKEEKNRVKRREGMRSI